MAVGSVVVCGLAYGIVLSYRLDYLGHFLAGFGGTLLLLAPIVLASQETRAYAIVTVTLVAITLGFGTESTIFKLAIFDRVDFFNQSLGGVLAGALAVNADRTAAAAIQFGVLAILTVVVGFYFAFA